MKHLFIPLIFVFSIIACNPSGSTTTNSSKSKKIKTEWFYGTWKVVAFRFSDGRVMPAEYMGYPKYDFSKDGKRTKTLVEQPPPPPEITEYKIEGDSVKYPNSKFPAMKIERLSKDTLVLANDKLSWYLAK